MTFSLRQRVLAGESLIGTFCAIPHPAATEMVATAGFDFLCLDTEHSAIGRETAEDMIRAAAAQHTAVLVRVAGNTPELIAAALDSGAAGVVVPRVTTADQARAAVAATRYPPAGSRGAGPGRASAYGGGLGGYLGTANDDLLLAVQVETAEAVENVAEIAAVEGVDMVFIGPGDLSVSLGAFAGTETDTARVTQAIDTVIEKTLAQSQRLGIFRPTTEDLNHWATAGVTLFIINAESVFMMNTAAHTAATARAELGGA